ncbi:MAG TPA: hypothetical protein DD856_17975 [Sulfobacillus sp.]|nr:hypothetical protein [Sulfobacillus sp.]
MGWVVADGEYIENVATPDTLVFSTLFDDGRETSRTDHRVGYTCLEGSAVPQSNSLEPGES